MIELFRIDEPGYQIPIRGIIINDMNDYASSMELVNIILNKTLIECFRCEDEVRREVLDAININEEIKHYEIL